MPTTQRELAVRIEKILRILKKRGAGCSNCDCQTGIHDCNRSVGGELTRGIGSVVRQSAQCECVFALQQSSRTNELSVNTATSESR